MTDEATVYKVASALAEGESSPHPMPGQESAEVAPPERAWDRIRSYGFCVGGWKFLLPQGLYSELLANPTVAPLPNSPPHFYGLTNLRGNLVPVYRLDGLFQRTSMASDVRLALLVGDVARGVALEVDAKPEALDLSQFAHTEPARDEVPTPLRDLITSVYRNGSGEWWLLDHHRLCARLCGRSEAVSEKVAPRGAEQDRNRAQGVGESTNQGEET